MLSIIIPTYNSAASVKETLSALVPPPYAREIIVVDGGSSDETVALANQAADKVVLAQKGRGTQLKAGAAQAEGDWLLFLHADTVLPAGWGQNVCHFMTHHATEDTAAYFRFCLDDDSPWARRLEKIVDWRSRKLGLPYGDQGLLIRRTFYEELGGFGSMVLMEDVDMVRRIGKKRLQPLDVVARTSAQRYRQNGYVKRMIRNATCLSLYFLGLSPQKISKFYE